MGPFLLPINAQHSTINRDEPKLKLAGIIASMSRKGNCYDNAHVESFFHSLKVELVYRNNFKTREEAKQAIFRWVAISTTKSGDTQDWIISRPKRQKILL